jgi:hypothetical protein
MAVAAPPLAAGGRRGLSRPAQRHLRRNRQARKGEAAGPEKEKGKEIHKEEDGLKEKIHYQENKALCARAVGGQAQKKKKAR